MIVFVGGGDSGKITDITDKTGSTYWKNQYVLGDYEITPIEDEKSKELTTEEKAIKLLKYNGYHITKDLPQR